MWHLYVIISMLTAGVVMKLTGPLLRRDRHDVTRADRRLALGLTCLLPTTALVIYLFSGRPDLPGMPAIFTDAGALMMRQEALLAKRPFETLVKTNPNSIGAVVKLADINQRLGRFAEAAKFMQRAVLLAQQQGDIYLRIYAENLGRFQVLANGGIVGTDALGTFAYVRTLKDVDPIARYYQALAKAQRGDTDGAIAEWNDLLSEGSTMAYWKEYVRQAIAVTKAGKLGQQPINVP
ncbi:MAG: tetratricopeptide repeat protein [Alphaproteobacteria bacterium]